MGWSAAMARICRRRANSRAKVINSEGEYQASDVSRRGDRDRAHPIATPLRTLQADAASARLVTGLDDRSFPRRRSNLLVHAFLDKK